MSELAKKHPHYHKSVANLESIDVYRVLSLFAVTDPCIQHAVKKLLVAGGRGAGKDITKDVKEAMDSCQRFLEMREEDKSCGAKIGISLESSSYYCEETATMFYCGQTVQRMDDLRIGTVIALLRGYAVVDSEGLYHPLTWKLIDIKVMK